MPDVVPLDVKHIPMLIDLIEHQHHDSQLDHLGFSRTKVEHTLATCIAEPTQWCEVVEHHGEPWGIMAGHVTSMLFSHHKLGVEELLVVRPDCPTRTKYAARMVRDFVEWCLTFDCADVRAGVISNIDNTALDQFYRICGFKRIGTVYSLRNPGGV